MIDAIEGWYTDPGKGILRESRPTDQEEEIKSNVACCSKKRRSSNTKRHHEGSSLKKKRKEEKNHANDRVKKISTPSTIATTTFDSCIESQEATTTTVVKFPSFPFKENLSTTMYDGEAAGLPSLYDTPMNEVEGSPCLLEATMTSEEDEESETICSSPIPTPNAPRRTKSLTWLRYMLENSNEELEAALLADADIDVTCDVFVEWIEWSGPDHLSGSSVVWVPPICLASRWNSPKIIQTLVDAGADIQASNHLQQNLLAILCSQPVLTPQVLLALRDVYKPEIFNLSRHHLDAQGAQVPVAVEQFIKFRKQEIILVAQLLLLLGVSPIAHDFYGKSAMDYCLEFGHKSLYKLCKAAIRNPMIYMSGVKPVETRGRQLPPIDLSRCRTPSPSSRRQASTVCTPPRTLVRTPQQRSDVDFSTPIAGSINCPSSMPTCCPSTAVNVKRRGRRLSGTKGNWMPQELPLEEASVFDNV